MMKRHTEMRYMKLIKDREKVGKELAKRAAESSYGE